MAYPEDEEKSGVDLPGSGLPDIALGGLPDISNLTNKYGLTRPTAPKVDKLDVSQLGAMTPVQQDRLDVSSLGEMTPAPVAPVSRGFMSELGTDIQRIPRAVAIQAANLAGGLAPDNGPTEQRINKFIDTTTARQEQLYPESQQNKESFVRRGITAIPSTTATSLAMGTGPSLAAEAVLQPLAAPFAVPTGGLSVAAAHGLASAFGGVSFGLSTYHETYRNLKKLDPNMSDAAAKAGALRSAAIEGVGETVGNFLLLKYLGGAGKAVTKGIAETTVGKLLKPPAGVYGKELVRSGLPMLGSEVGTEIGQSMGETYVQRKALTDAGWTNERIDSVLPSVWKSGAEAIIPTIGMTVFTAGLGGGVKMKMDANAAAALVDGKVDSKERIKALKRADSNIAEFYKEEIAARAKEYQKDGLSSKEATLAARLEVVPQEVNAWFKNATDAILTKKPIDLSQPVNIGGKLVGADRAANQMVSTGKAEGRTLAAMPTMTASSPQGVDLTGNAVPSYKTGAADATAPNNDVADINNILTRDLTGRATPSSAPQTTGPALTLTPPGERAAAPAIDPEAAKLAKRQTRRQDLLNTNKAFKSAMSDLTSLYNELRNQDGSMVERYNPSQALDPDTPLSTLRALAKDGEKARKTLWKAKDFASPTGLGTTPGAPESTQVTHGEGQYRTTYTSPVELRKKDSIDVYYGVHKDSTGERRVGPLTVTTDPTFAQSIAERMGTAPQDVVVKKDTFNLKGENIFDPRSTSAVEMVVSRIYNDTGGDQSIAAQARAQLNSGGWGAVEAYKDAIAKAGFTVYMGAENNAMNFGRLTPPVAQAPAAPTAPAAAPTGVAFTKQDIQELGARGYSTQQINSMKPEEAKGILAQPRPERTQPPPPVSQAAGNAAAARQAVVAKRKNAASEREHQRALNFPEGGIVRRLLESGLRFKRNDPRIKEKFGKDVPSGFWDKFGPRKGMDEEGFAPDVVAQNIGVEDPEELLDKLVKSVTSPEFSSRWYGKETGEDRQARIEEERAIEEDRKENLTDEELASEKDLPEAPFTPKAAPVQAGEPTSSELPANATPLELAKHEARRKFGDKVADKIREYDGPLNLQQKSAALLGEIFGSKAIFMENLPFDGLNYFSRGFSIIDTKTDRPTMFIFGHESGHQFVESLLAAEKAGDKEAGKVVRRLIDFVNKNYSKDDRAKWIALRGKEMSSSNIDVNDESLQKEYISDLFGWAFGTKDFMVRLQAQDKNLYTRVVDSIKDTVKKFLSIFKNPPAVFDKLALDTLYSNAPAAPADVRLVMDELVKVAVYYANNKDRLVKSGVINQEALAMVKAQHASPHKFDKVKLWETIGTGQGAASFGAGWYVSTHPDTHKQYLNEFSRNGFFSWEAKRNGKTISGDDILEEYFKPGRVVDGYGGKDKVVSFNRKDGDWSVSVKQVKGQFGTPAPYDEPVRTHRTQPETNQVERVLIEEGWQIRKAYSYDVELDVNDEDLLDWDKPLSEQSEKVKKAINAEIEKLRSDARESSLSWGDLADPGKVETFHTGSMVYHSLVSEKGGKEAASRYLASIGIPGIRYLDGGSRMSVEVDEPPSGGFRVITAGPRGASAEYFNTHKEANEFADKKRKESTHNYVIFDDSLITLTHRNDEPLASPKFGFPGTFTKEKSDAFAEDIKAHSGEVATRSRLAEARDKAIHSIGQNVATTPERIVVENRLKTSAAMWSPKITREQDAEYMKAAESGDLKTAQMLVDAAAKAAGYGTRAYHTGPKKIAEFSKEHISRANQYGPAFYFTDQKASSIRGVKTGVYLKLANPADVNSKDFPAAAFESSEPVKAAGHDGFVKTYSNGAKTYGVYDPNQIKSADPITRDGKGKIIPLSKRFNEKSDDIRYSPKSGDSPSFTDFFDSYKRDIGYEETPRKAGKLAKPLSPEASGKTPNNKVRWDARKGLGEIPDGKSIGYHGFVKTMTPREFIELSSNKSPGKQPREYNDEVEKLYNAGASLAPPFLEVGWRDGYWAVLGHEGRSRADLAGRINPDEPMPVQFFPTRMKAADIAPKMRNAPIKPQLYAKQLPKKGTEGQLYSPKSTRPLSPEHKMWLDRYNSLNEQQAEFTPATPTKQRVDIKRQLSEAERQISVAAMNARKDMQGMGGLEGKASPKAVDANYKSLLSRGDNGKSPLDVNAVDKWLTDNPDTANKLHATIRDLAMSRGYTTRAFNGVSGDPGYIYGPHQNVREEGGRFGFFFTPYQQVAEDYSGANSRNDSANTVREVYLRLGNNLDFGPSDTMTRKEFITFFQTKGIDVTGVLSSPDDLYGEDSFSIWLHFLKSYGANPSGMRQLLLDNGYDSLTINDDTAVPYDDTIKKNSKEKYIGLTYIMLRPGDIKLADPVTIDNGEVVPPSKRMNSNELDIRYSPKALARSVDVRDPLSQERITPTYDFMKQGRWGKFVRRARLAIQDKDANLKELVQTLEGIKGATLEDVLDPKLHLEINPGIDRAMLDNMYSYELLPTFHFMLDNGIDFRNMETHLLMRTAKQTNATIAKINDVYADPNVRGGSGVTDPQVDAYFAALPAAEKAKLDQAAKMFEDFRAETRRIILDGGIESQETVDRWVKSNGVEAMPMHRDGMDDVGVGTGTRGIDSRGAFSHRRFGSDLKVVNIIGHLKLERERAINKAVQNRGILATYAFFATYSAPQIAYSVNPEMARVGLTKSRVVDALVNKVGMPKWQAEQVWDATGNSREKFFDELTRLGYTEEQAFDSWDDAIRRYIKTNPTMQRQINDLMDAGVDADEAIYIFAPPKERYFNKSTGKVDFRSNPQFLGRDNVIGSRINGQNRYVVFNRHNEQALQTARNLQNLDNGKVEGVYKVANKWSRFVSAMATSWDVFFAPFNFARDIGTMNLNLTDTVLAGHQVEVMKNMKDAWFAIHQDLRAKRKGQAPSGPMTALIEEAASQGAFTGYRDSFDNQQQQIEQLEKDFKNLDDSDAKGKIRWAGRYLKQAVEDWNSTFENATRIAVYKAAIDNGLSKARAAQLAKNITVNFNLKGTNSAQMNSLYAFFGASVQGAWKMTETLTGKAGKRIIAGGVFLGVMQGMLLVAMGFDDDDLDEYVKSRSLILPFPNGRYAAIPMPLGFNMLPSIGRNVFDSAYSMYKGEDSKKTLRKYIPNIFESLMNATNPLGSTGRSMQTVAPTMFDPMAAIIENLDYAARPIHKSDLSSRHKTPGHMRVKDTASTPAKLASRGFNALMGGDKYTPGVLSPTPDDIDYLFGQVFGGVGRQAVRLEKIAEGLYNDTEIPTYNIPIAGRLYGNKNENYNIRNRFYNNIREFNTLKDNVDGRKEDHIPLAEFYQTHPEARLLPLKKDIESDLRKLETSRRELLDRKNPPKARIEYIDKQILGIMKKFNTKVDEKIRRD